MMCMSSSCASSMVARGWGGVDHHHCHRWSFPCMVFSKPKPTLMLLLRCSCSSSQPQQKQVVADGGGDGDGDGDGSIEYCQGCQGRGWLVCDTCNGQKTNVKAVNNRIYRRCPSCKAVGYILCSNCKVFKCVTFPNYSDEGGD